MGWGWVEDNEFFEQLLLGAEEEEETVEDLPPILVELAGEGQEAVVPLAPIAGRKKEKRLAKPNKESRPKQKAKERQERRTEERENGQLKPSRKQVAANRPTQHESAEQERGKPSKRRMAVSFAISSALVPQPKAGRGHQKGNIFTIG